MANEHDTTLQNADAAAEALARSNRESIRPDTDPARETALDEAFAASAAKGQVAPGQDPDKLTGQENGGVRLPIEGAPTNDELAQEAAAKADSEKAAADKAVADAAEAAEAAEAAKKSGQDPAKSGQPKGLLDDLIADKPAAAELAKDPYGDVKLRSDASPKTRETFEQLKAVAKQREETALAVAKSFEEKLAAAEAKTKELEGKVVPDEVQAELKDLRAFRAQFDTANDPEFRQKFDSRLNTNYESIYMKLSEHGLKEVEVAKLKSYGQADRDDAIEGFLSKLPAGSKKFIEAKLLSNVNVLDEREQALREARSKADEILAQRKQAPVQQASQRIDEIAKLIQPELAKLPWIHAREVPANAAPEDRKRIETENQNALALQEALKSAITDDSPKTRALAALSVPLAKHYSRLYVQERDRAEGLQKQLDAVKNASATARTARSAASPAAAAPAAPAAPVDSADAIDALFAASTGRTAR